MEPLSKADWVHVFDREGKDLGYLPLSDCETLGYPVFIALPSETMTSDPYFIYHSRMAREQGYLQGDLNSVQESLLQAAMLRDWKREEALQELTFEQNMLINNPQMFAEYRERKQADEDAKNAGEIEWAAPEDIEELADIFSDIVEMAKDDVEPLPTSSAEEGLDDNIMRSLSD